MLAEAGIHQNLFLPRREMLGTHILGHREDIPAVPSGWLWFPHKLTLAAIGKPPIRLMPA